MNRFIRHKQLEYFLSLVDSKFDIDVEDYFTLTNEDRNELAVMIVDYFLPVIEEEPDALKIILIGLDILIGEAEFNEEYEKASLFYDALKKFRELTFLIK
jgi:hypothetical protein